jgi:hypothetical protein
VQAAVVELNKQAGLSHGKVARCLGSLFGIPLSRGGSVHTVLRAAARCEPVYESICQTVGQSDWVVPDETGWRVGGYPAWLHTLVGPEATAYVIDPTRGGAVAEAILGLAYDGTMIHDGWSPYDQFKDALRQPGLDATNWRAELAIRFGVILRKVWGGSRTWTGARAQSVLMSVWRTCWQQGRSALDFLSQLLRGTPAAPALPP